jgi:hypothetical protein
MDQQVPRVGTHRYSQPYACEVSRWKRVLCHRGLIYLNGIHEASTTQVGGGCRWERCARSANKKSFSHPALDVMIRNAQSAM